MIKQIDYKYKNTPKYTPEIIDKILEVKENKGLTANNLLYNAKDKKNPLHNFFDWDDSIAGEKWRLQQARVIINEVKIIIGEKELYAFENIHVCVETPEGEVREVREYKHFAEISSNKEYHKQMIDKALESIGYWQEKHSIYKELTPIFVSIDNVRKKWQKRK